MPPSIPVTPAAPSAPGTALRWAWRWGIVLAALAILFARRPGAFLRPQFWAEDFVYLTTAEKVGVSTLWTSLAGYFQLIPRAIAWPATFLDPVLQPAFFLAGSLAVVGWVILACLSPRHDLPWKPWLALAVVLVPHTGEVFFNPTNAQWVAVLGLLLTILNRDPARPREWVADLSFVLIAGFSGPFIVLALPLFLLRWVVRRSRASGILTLIAGVAAALTVREMVHTPGMQPYQGAFSASNLVANVSFRLFDTLYFGVLANPAMGRLAASVLGLGIAVAIMVGLERAFRRSAGHASERAVVADLAALLVFAAVLVASSTWRTRFDLFAFGESINADRYFYLPKVILLWVTAAAVALPGARLLRSLFALLLVCSVACNLPRFRFEEFQDDHWYEACPDIRAGRTVNLTINPGWPFTYRRGH